MGIAEVRVGVIGTGFGARVVAPVFAATEGCAVVDVVSARDAGDVAALCARRDVDVVSVHSPPFLHRAHVQRALDGGHAVLCDKPFGRDAGESAAMLAAAEAAGVRHLVNFEFRWAPLRQRLHELVVTGGLGRVELVIWEHVSSGSRVPLRPHGWLFERTSGGGWIGAWGSHAIDFLRWTLGELAVLDTRPRIDVTARPDALGGWQQSDAEDGFGARLETTGGATVLVESSFAASASLAPRLVVAGSDGVAELVADTRLVVRRPDGAREQHTWPPADAAPAGDPHLEPMRRWAVVVRDLVRSDARPAGIPTFADGLAVARVLDRLREGPRARRDG